MGCCGVLSQILYSGINILILPFVLRLLPTNELGLWYTFTSIGAIVMLFDFGFMTTLTRNVSYAWSGAKKIHKIGIENTSQSFEPNLELFSDVYNASRFIYLIVGLLALLILASIGSIYIY